MPQYMFPASCRRQIPDILSDSGTIAVTPRDPEPLIDQGNRWCRMECCAGRARAAACIGEHQQLPGKIVVTVSADLRRLPLFWRWPGDFGLVHRMRRNLERAGGQRVQDDEDA